MMSELIQPGSALLFMKVGTHAQESLDDIIARKRKEISDAGYAMWGYGGNTCHPRTMVQPFVEKHVQQHRKVYLCMQEVDSRHFADPVRADEYSVDGSSWIEIPKPINVLGSRFALVLKTLRKEEFPLELADTKVAIGLSQGKPGNKYVQGQVDKACLEFAPAESPVNQTQDRKEIKISLIAELKEPYAVFLRNN